MFVNSRNSIVGSRRKLLLKNMGPQMLRLLTKEGKDGWSTKCDLCWGSYLLCRWRRMCWRRERVLIPSVEPVIFIWVHVNPLICCITVIIANFWRIIYWRWIPDYPITDIIRFVLFGVWLDTIMNSCEPGLKWSRMAFLEETLRFVEHVDSRRSTVVSTARWTRRSCRIWNIERRRD